MDLWQVVYDSGPATMVRDSTWIFPLLEVIHIYSLIAVTGLIGAYDLRLLGRALMHTPLTTVSHSILRWIWLPVLVNALTGTMLFASKATEYVVNSAFQLKIALIVAGVLFHVIMLRKTAATSARPEASVMVRLLVVISLSVWAGVIVVSRWIAYA